MMRYFSIYLVMYFLLYSGLSIQAQLLMPYLFENEKYGFVDSTGSVIIPAAYAKVEDYFHSEKAFTVAYDDKNKAQYILRNGMVFQQSGNASANYVENFEENDQKATTVWKDIIAFKNNSEITYFHLKNGTQIKGILINHQDNLHWFPYNLHNLKGNYVKFAIARYGIIKIQTAPGQYNFFDANLKAIFKKPFTDGTVIDNQYFIVADENKKCAIATRDGKISTPFNWYGLAPSKKAGTFITNPSHENIGDKQIKSGVINSNGNYIVQPKHDKLTSLNEQWLMSVTEEGTSILDHNGNVFIGADKRFTDHLCGDLFIRNHGRGSVVINAHTGISMPDTFLSVAAHPRNVADDFILVYKKGNRTGIMEQNGKILLDSDYNNIHRLEVGKKNYFLGIDEKGRQTLLTSDYKKVFGMDFDKVEGYSGFIRLKDGEFYGLANTEGLLILPVQYKEIIISQSFTENIIYAKKTTTFLAFSEGGERMHQKDCMHPTESRKKYYLPYGKKGEAQTVLLYDGTEVKAPMNWGTRFPMDVIESPVGPLVVLESTSNYTLYNSKLEAIQPERTTIPRKYGNPPSFASTGMMPLFTINPNAKPDLAPQVENQKSDVVVSTQQNKLEKDIPEFVNQDLQGEYITGCGVMDATGKWVITPKKNTRMVPVSWNVVLEYELHGLEKDTWNPHTLHIVHTDKPKKIDIAGANISGTKPWKTALIYQKEPLTAKTYCSYITTEGELLSPFQFHKAPDTLKSFNLVTVYENNTNNYSIIDNRARLVANLGKLERAHSYFNGGYIGVEKDGKWGIVDSIGQWEWPAKYGEIRIIQSGKLVQDRIDKQYRLFNWQQQEVLTASSDFNLIKSEIGHYFINYTVDKGKRCAIFNDKDQLVTIVNDGHFISMKNVEGSISRFAEFKNETSKSFYYNINQNLILRSYK